MQYDFNVVVDRTGTGSEKWEDMRTRDPSVKPGIIPFSVADMEVASPPEVIAGLKEYMDRGILGYTVPTEPYYAAVLDWMRRRHNWTVEKEWVVETNGVVPAFFAAIHAYTEPGDGVMIMTPVYRPFFLAVENNDRLLAEIPLLETAGGYEIDFDLLAAEAAKPRNKALLLCSPHNPVGRVWTRPELEKIADICLRNGVFVISDEIHFDLLMPGFVHHVFADLGSEVAKQCLIATSPSKTFNLAGIQGSNIVIPDADARKRFIRERRKHGLMENNIFAYKACELAYRRCEAWLDALLDHVHGNYRLLVDFMAKRFPEVKVHRMEGTYLAWMDFRAWKLPADELQRFMEKKAQVFFSEGGVFGKEGIGFERMNLACPRPALEAALQRIADARG